MDILIEFTPEFAKMQMDEKAMLFKNDNYQAILKKYKLLAGIAAAAVLNSNNCTRMRVRQVKGAGITAREVAGSIMATGFKKQAVVLDTVNNSLQVLFENKM